MFYQNQLLIRIRGGEKDLIVTGEFAAETFLERKKNILYRRGKK